MADRRLAARAKWMPHADVAPARQAIAAMKTPRAHPLAYLLRRARLTSSVHAEPSAVPLRFATSVLTPASPQLCHHPL